MSALNEWCRGKLRRFRRDQAGVAAVEFGMVALPFLGIVLFALQAALSSLTAFTLETFNQDTSRQILTGTVQPKNLTPAQYKAQLCGRLPALLQCSQLYVDIRAVTQFNNADTSRPTLAFDGAGNVTNPWVYSPGNPGDIVTVKMMYITMPVPTLLGSMANQINGARLVMSIVVFKNEPYSS